MKNTAVFFLSLILLSAATETRSAQHSPIYIANQNPFVQIYGLPKAEAGFITPQGKLDATFFYYVSNNAISNDPGNGEAIVWDGETAQYGIKLRYGVLDRLELGVDVPYIQHSGGYLDSVIRQFHSFLGFPNDRQEQFDKNEIHYQVDENGNVLYNMTENRNGIGDLRLSAAVPLFPESIRSRRHLAARSVLKLPTGASEDLLGSGGTDVSAGLAYTDYELLKSMNTVLSANLGAVYLGDSDILSEKQRNFAGYGGVSLDWLARHWLELKLQLDMHSSLYDSELVQLGSSLQLLAGATVHLQDDVLLDLGISEQLVTDATPDVGFYLMVSHLF